MSLNLSVTLGRTDTTLDLSSKQPIIMLSRLCKDNKNKKAFLSPKIELTFVQGPFRPKINCNWSLYFSWLFLLSAETSKKGKKD